MWRKDVAPLFAICPACKQKLALQDYMVLVDAEVVCNNCETNLRVESARPFRLRAIPVEETFNADMRPESYG
jgi:Zn finger protein HypA/HybF involved in hydrogenase expression